MDRENGGVIDNLSVLAMRWVFSQSHPLTTSNFISELKKRGVDLDCRPGFSDVA